MWYLGEFNVELTNPWPFTATNDYGLAPGTVLDVLAMDYNRQAWASGGTATVSKDGVDRDRSGERHPGARDAAPRRVRLSIGTTFPESPPFRSVIAGR